MSAICAKIITYPWMWLFMRSPSQGAQTITYLALEPSITNISGEYFKWVPCSLSLCLIGQIYSWASRLFAKIKNPPLAVCLVLIKLLIASFIYQPSLLVFVELLVSRKILAHFSSPSAWKSPNNLPVSIRVLIHLFSLSPSLQRLPTEGRRSTAPRSGSHRTTDWATGQGVPRGCPSSRN